MVENLHVSGERASGRGLTERVPPRAVGSGLAEHSIDCKSSAADRQPGAGHPDITTAAGLGKSRMAARASTATLCSQPNPDPQQSDCGRTVFDDERVQY